MRKFVNFLILFSFLTSDLVDCNCGNGIFAKGVKSNDKNHIIRLHNDIRQKALQGQIPGQPRAKRMQKLLWDESLAYQAQIIADSCEFAHKEVKDGRFWYVGQNLAIFPIYYQSQGFDWNGAVNMWYDEHKIYKYTNQFDRSTGHYTQLVWADTQYVGCGSTSFKPNNDRWYQKLYVCNYGPGGNIYGQFPYERA